MKEYRLVIRPKMIAKGPWREAREEAVLDALEQDLAWPDEHQADRIYWHPLAYIEERGD